MFSFEQAYTEATKENEIRNKVKNYNLIPSMTYEKYNGFFQHLPGIYCWNCGETFALYSYSAMQPHGFDPNGKPFYYSCFKCEKK